MTDTPTQRYERAQDALREAVRQWKAARARWEQDGSVVADYDRDVRPWAEEYERCGVDAFVARQAP
ncbi:MAG: hypothetical protein M3506_00370 [Chloroflexota bacterium]|nr:hypothetical protein [Chloroflexota bacterium]